MKKKIKNEIKQSNKIVKNKMKWSEMKYNKIKQALWVSEEE